MRGGKFGDDKLVIIYNYTVPTDKGKHPNVFIIQLQNFTYIKKDVYFNDLFMNTCEDFKTFADGVLIWASSNSDGKLVINKIGKPLLDKSYDDINDILTKEDVIDYDKEMSPKSNNKSMSLSVKIFIGVGIAIGFILIIFGIFMLLKCIKKRKINESDVYKVNGSLLNNIK